MTTALYRFYGDTCNLLYVGITNNMPARLAEHAGDKPWFTEVVSVLVDHFDDRASAQAAERHAIITERPAHNKVHNGPRPPIVVAPPPCTHPWVEADAYGNLACCDCDIVLPGSPLSGRRARWVAA